MRILIAGAAGLIGTRLATASAAAGDTVSALVRDVSRASRRLPGATLHAWEGTAGQPPAAAFDGVDGVVNLMGESISKGRWSEARKKVLRDSRIVSTRALVDALRGLTRRPRVLVSASAVGYYGDRGDEILTEASAPGTGFLSDLARDWEAEALRAQELGMRVVLIRTGVVLDRHGGMLGTVLPVFRLGLGGRIGSGQQWFPWIHVDDEVGLIRHALTAEGVTGPLNAVAPEPVTNREFTSVLAATLSRPAALAAPAFALRMAVGAKADDVLLASQRAMPVRTLETGFQFRYPLLRPALKAALAASG
ncbi:MAG TPA: TIGR01777 family oxidoreductase [Polyangia bacterium]|nr:TIGR01777 family oxidoreductase [Polyangia bacterium]